MMLLHSSHNIEQIQHLKQKEMKVSRIFLSHSLNERILHFLSARKQEMGEKMLSLDKQVCIYVSVMYKMPHFRLISSVLKT